MVALNFSVAAHEDLAAIKASLPDSDMLSRHISTIQSAMNTGVKFILPENGALIADAENQKPGLKYKLPFPVCVLEYKGTKTDKATAGILQWDAVTIAAEDTLRGEDGFYLFSVIKTVFDEDYGGMLSGRWFPLPGMVFLPYDQACLDIDLHGLFPYAFRMGKKYPFWAVPAEPTDERIKEFIGNMVVDANAVINLCACLACGNVSMATVPAPAALNKKREKKGKLPFFEYKMLVLKPSVEGGERHGGTHSSPRLHLRRGHIRQYKPGQYTWVSPSVVGNKAKGLVVKDYVVQN